MHVYYVISAMTLEFDLIKTPQPQPDFDYEMLHLRYTYTVKVMMTLMGPQSPIVLDVEIATE